MRTDLDPHTPLTEMQHKRLCDFGWPVEEARGLMKWEASYALDRHKTIMAEWAAQRTQAWAQLMGWEPQDIETAMTQQLWQLTPATAKQRALLTKFKVPEELVLTLTKGEASRLIDTELQRRGGKGGVRHG